jgi:predicted transcriptional regulator
MKLKIEAISNVDALQRKVLRYVADQGLKGATSDEIEAGLGIGHKTVSPRVRELFKKSYLRDSGRERVTRMGRRAIVWILDQPKAVGSLNHDRQAVA